MLSIQLIQCSHREDLRHGPAPGWPPRQPASPKLPTDPAVWVSHFPGVVTVTEHLTWALPVPHLLCRVAASGSPPTRKSTPFSAPPGPAGCPSLPGQVPAQLRGLAHLCSRPQATHLAPHPQPTSAPGASWASGKLSDVMLPLVNEAEGPESWARPPLLSICFPPLTSEQVRDLSPPPPSDVARERLSSGMVGAQASLHRYRCQWWSWDWLRSEPVLFIPGLSRCPGGSLADPTASSRLLTPHSTPWGMSIR